jgi:hypothetical protein
LRALWEQSFTTCTSVQTEYWGHRLGWPEKRRKAMNKKSAQCWRLARRWVNEFVGYVWKSPSQNSHNIYMSIELYDETEILIEVESRPYFSIMHLARDSHGELEPVKEPIRGVLRSLVKGGGDTTRCS